MKPPKKIGLVLTGGGARAGYQVGALVAIAEIAHGMGISSPFQVITGTSAGALNATLLAAFAHNVRLGSRRLHRMWSHLHTDSIYRVDVGSLAKMGSKWLWQMSTGGLSPQKDARALLDTSPIRQMIESEFLPGHIEARLQDKSLDSLAIRSINYGTGRGVVFYQSRELIDPWYRVNLVSCPTIIQPAHLLSSASIPILFPPVKIENDYYGDGSLRNQTPLSPAVKLGAEKLVVIGVKRAPNTDVLSEFSPSPARIFGLLLNTVLLDAIDLDYERMMRINDTLSKLKKGSKSELRPIDVCLIRPSEDLGAIAAEEAPKMPRTMQYLLDGLGSRNESADLISYLLFEPAFVNRLIELGYEDTMSQKDALIELFS